MDLYSTKPIEEIDTKRFKNALTNKNIAVPLHALDHLSRGQRKIFKVRQRAEISQSTFIIAG